MQRRPRQFDEVISQLATLYCRHHPAKHEALLQFIPPFLAPPFLHRVAAATTLAQLLLSKMIAWLDSCAVAVGTRTPSAVLGRHVMRGPKKRPAAGIWPRLLAATTLPATPPRRVETPLVDPDDSRTTRRTERTGGRTRSRTRSRLERRRNNAARCGPRVILLHRKKVPRP